MSEKPELLEAGLKACADLRPLIYAANKENLAVVAELAKANKVPVAVKGSNIDELVQLTEELNKAGVKDLVLDSGSRKLRQAFQDQIAIRSALCLRKCGALGYPTIVSPRK